MNKFAILILLLFANCTERALVCDLPADFANLVSSRLIRVLKGNITNECVSAVVWAWHASNGMKISEYKEQLSVSLSNCYFQRLGLHKNIWPCNDHKEFDKCVLEAQGFLWKKINTHTEASQKASNFITDRFCVKVRDLLIDQYVETMEGIMEDFFHSLKFEVPDETSSSWYRYSAKLFSAIFGYVFLWESFSTVPMLHIFYPIAALIFYFFMRTDTAEGGIFHVCVMPFALGFAETGTLWAVTKKSSPFFGCECATAMLQIIFKCETIFFGVYMILTWKLCRKKTTLIPHN